MLLFSVSSTEELFLLSLTLFRLFFFLMDQIYLSASRHLVQSDSERDSAVNE